MAPALSGTSCGGTICAVGTCVEMRLERDLGEELFSSGLGQPLALGFFHIVLSRFTGET